MGTAHDTARPTAATSAWLKEDSFLSYLDIGSAYLGKGEFDKALDWYQRGQRIEASVRSYDAFIARALAALGRREAEILAMGYAALGNADAAFRCLERAYRDRSGSLIYFHLDPGYGPLRADPRFDELVQRIGLK